MVVMLVGLVVFLGVHLIASLRGLRAKLIAALGEKQYKGFFSLLSVAGLGLIAYGFALWRAAGSALIWDPPMGLRHLVLLLMVFVTIAAVAAYVPSHIRTFLKHPLLAAVKVWALGHLLANGDAASMVLFGSILAWAVYARISAKRRGAPVPAAPAGYGGDLIAVIGGLVLYGVLAFWFHPHIVGVPVIG